MATLTVQRCTADTVLAVTLAPASGGGDAFPNDGRTVFRVANASGGSITVTFAAVKKCNQGFTHNSARAVPDATTADIGPFETARFNDANGKVQVTYSGATGVTVAAVGI